MTRGGRRCVAGEGGGTACEAPHGHYSGQPLPLPPFPLLRAKKRERLTTHTHTRLHVNTDARTERDGSSKVAAHTVWAAKVCSSTASPLETGSLQMIYDARNCGECGGRAHCYRLLLAESDTPALLHLSRGRGSEVE